MNILTSECSSYVWCRSIFWTIASCSKRYILEAGLPRQFLFHLLGSHISRWFCLYSKRSLINADHIHSRLIESIQIALGSWTIDWIGPMAKTWVYVRAERVTMKRVVSKQFQCRLVQILQAWAGNYKRALEFLNHESSVKPFCLLLSFKRRLKDTVQHL